MIIEAFNREVYGEITTEKRSLGGIACGPEQNAKSSALALADTGMVCATAFAARSINCKTTKVDAQNF